MKTFVKWAKKEPSLSNQLIASLLAGLLFVGIIPYILLRGLQCLDSWLGLPPMPSATALILAGGVLLIIGAPIGFWAVITQLIKGRGTPLPMFPTQDLLTRGLYAWSRNPMVFGTLAAYLGLSLISASWSSLTLVVLFALFLVLYLKCIEERELAERFGESYLAYKQRTSFLIPWPRRNQ